MEVWNYKGVDIFKLGKRMFAFDKHKIYPTLAAAKADISRLLKEREQVAA